MKAWKSAALVLAGVGAWEAGWWLRRRNQRSEVYAQAERHAKLLNKPLVVVGAPDGGVTAGYGCGDLVVDIAPSKCKNSSVADITKRIPLEDNSAVVFVACVLEYVSDYEAAMKELLRVSGGNLYVVRVEPWTLTAYLYPGAKRTVQPYEPQTPLLPPGSDRPLVPKGTEVLAGLGRATRKY